MPVVLGPRGSGRRDPGRRGRRPTSPRATTSCCRGCRSAARAGSARRGGRGSASWWPTSSPPGGVLHDGTSRWGGGLHHYLGRLLVRRARGRAALGRVKIRDDAPLDVVAIVGCAVATGVGAVLNTAAVPEGATVAVIGCGGVGLSVIQGARLAERRAHRGVRHQPGEARRSRPAWARPRPSTERGRSRGRAEGGGAEGLDFVFDAIGRIETTEQAIAALGPGGAAVIVGLPPTGSTARFDPLVLAEANQRILGSNYGSVDPQRDIPWLVDRYMDGELDLDALVSGRRPLAEAAEALDDLAAGRTLAHVAHHPRGGRACPRRLTGRSASPERSASSASSGCPRSSSSASPTWSRSRCGRRTASSRPRPRGTSRSRTW